MEHLFEDTNNLLLDFKKKRQKHIPLPINIFSILKIDHLEVLLHTTLISELLNPKGKHGYGKTFLNVFLDILNISKIEYEKYTDISISKEKFTKGISNDKETGGQIDILIEFNESERIIIENKIYAKDQEKQLIRYHNFDKSARIFYLTLDGHYPSNFSIKEREEVIEKITCISYTNEILEWLNMCLEKIDKEKDFLLYSIIIQYIDSINNLTKGCLYMNEKRKLADRMFNSIEESFAIANNIDELKKKLIEELKKQINEKWKLEGNIPDCDNNLTINYQIKNTEYYIYIYSDSTYGIINRTRKYTEKQLSMIKEILPEEVSHGPSWLWYSKFEWDKEDWNSTNPWLNIKNEKYVIVPIMKIEEIMNYLKNDIEEIFEKPINC